MIFNLIYKYILVLLITVLVVPNIKAGSKDQDIKIALRTIGHEFLLHINDSTSRVLPIEKINGRYVVQFERDFSFEPDILFYTATKVLEATKVVESYIIEVEKCETKELMHSAEIDFNKDVNEIACKGRLLPEGCYVFFFTVVENKQSVEPSVSAISYSLNYIYVIIVIITIGAYIIYLNRRKRRNPDLINIGQYQFDHKGMVLMFKTQLIELSSKESDLLFLLISNENKIIERNYILNVVWGDEGNYVGRTLDVFISKLRKKIEADSSLKIINIRGIGYKFVVN